MVAMVPDGVSQVEVTGVSGSTSAVEVVNNVADDTTQANVVGLRYTMPDGKGVASGR